MWFSLVSPPPQSRERGSRQHFKLSFSVPGLEDRLLIDFSDAAFGHCESGLYIGQVTSKLWEKTSTMSKAPTHSQREEEEEHSEQTYHKIEL